MYHHLILLFMDKCYEGKDSKKSHLPSMKSGGLWFINTMKSGFRKIYFYQIALVFLQNLNQ